MNPSEATLAPSTRREPTPRGRFAGLRWPLRLGAVALAAGVLYALSFGPAMRLNQQGVLSVATLEKAYLPLMVVSDLVPGMPRFLEAYSRKWLAPTPALP